MVGTELLHPEDVLFFAEVAAAMKKVAHKYNLGLKVVGHLPDNYVGFDTDRWGQCFPKQGRVELLLRAKVNGRWTDDSLSPQAVWDTAAHELAHLRYYTGGVDGNGHGEEHAVFTEELKDALANATEDHRERVLRKVVKMQAQAQSEAKIGNVEAADAFARMVNKMLIENELRPSDVDYARAQLDDPVVEVEVDLARYGMPVRAARSQWQELLASVVSKAHLCTFLIRPRTNRIWMVGTKSHATVAEYSYGVLVSAAEKIADKEWIKYYDMCRQMGDTQKARGFRQSWLRAFVVRISQRFDEERRKMIAGGNLPSSTTAIVRLDSALTKVRRYIDDKFKKGGHASALAGYGADHPDGRAWGRAAADRMAIGQRGMEASAIRGSLAWQCGQCQKVCKHQEQLDAHVALRHSGEARRS